MRKMKRLVASRPRLVAVGSYGAMNALPQLTTAFLALVYTSVFSLPEYGAYGALSAVSGVLAIVLDMGLSQAIFRNYYDRHADDAAASAYLSSIVYASKVVAFVALPLIGLVFYILWNWLYPDFSSSVFYILLLLGVSYFDRSTEMLGVLCRALERPLAFALGRIVQTLVTIIIAVGTVFVLDMHISGAFLALLGGRIGSSSTYYFLLRDKLVLHNARFDWHHMKEGLALGLPFVPSRLGNWARTAGPRAALVHTTPLYFVGLFSLGSSIASLPSLLSTAVDLALGPHYFKMRTADSVPVTDKMKVFGTVFGGSLVPIWAGLILFSREIVGLFSQEYAGAAPICAVLFVATFLRTQQQFVTRQLYFLRQTWIFPLITIPVGLGCVFSALVLSPLYGIVAAAWSVVIADMLVFISVAWAVRRIEPLDYRLDHALCFFALLFSLSVWVVADEPLPVYWSPLGSKMVFLALVSCGCVWMWIWPNRRFIRAIVAG